MAVIQTIRTKYAKLTSAVIVVALLGFVLMDFGKSGGSRSTTIGKINGQEVDYTEYEAAIKMRESEIKSQNPTASLDDVTQAQIRDQVWDDLVKEKLLADVNEKLGITVSKAELNDLLTGPNPDPMVVQAFTNPQTGEFNPQEVSANIQKLRKDPNMKAQWEQFEESLVQRRYNEKFETLVKGGIYTPKFILEDQLAATNDVANIQFVKLPYSLVNDEEIKVTDEEITAYMKKHPKLFYINQDSRSIDYVSFRINPSANDSARVLNSLETIKENFATTDDAEAFVNVNSESPNAPTYFTATQLSGLPNQEELSHAGVNTVVGPFYDGTNFVLAKILEKKNYPDSVKVRHILVQTKAQGQDKRTQAEAKARIDSAIAMLKAGTDFATVATEFSDDAGSQNTGGEYEFMVGQKPQISKEFGDFIFEGTTGSSNLVEVSNDNYSGYHYIEILSQSPRIPVSKIAFVTKSLSPDKETYNKIYSEATAFATKVNNKVDFDKAAQESSVPTAVVNGINKNSFLLNGLGSSRDLVKWAYDAKVGDVSPIYTIGDQYVIAKLKGVQNKGLVNIDDNTRPILVDYVKREKAAKILSEKYKASGSLESVAQASSQEVQTSLNVSFAQGYTNELGNEPKVVGYTFYKGLKENTVSPAIAGNDGLFYISVTGHGKAENPVQDLNNMRMMLENSTKANAYQIIMNSMKEAADVKDKRSDIY